MGSKSCELKQSELLLVKDYKTFVTGSNCQFWQMAHQITAFVIMSNEGKKPSHALEIEIDKARAHVELVGFKLFCSKIALMTNWTSISMYAYICKWFHCKVELVISVLSHNKTK